MRDDSTTDDTANSDATSSVSTLTPPIRERARSQMDRNPEDIRERAMVTLPAISTLYQAAPAAMGIQMLYNNGKISEDILTLHNRFATAYFESMLPGNIARELFHVTDPEDTCEEEIEMKARIVAGEVDFLLEVSEHFHPDTEDDSYYNFLQSLEDALEVAYVPTESA
jgi:hypothetical protein